MKALVSKLRTLAGHDEESLLPFWSGWRAQKFLQASAVLPAVVVILSIVLGGILILGPGDRITTWYDQHGSMALGDRDFKTARICYEGLLNREPDNPAYQFGLALSLAGLGENAEAMILINRLAPENGQGFAPAHVFVAEQLLTSPSAGDAARRSAETHLLRVVQVQPNNAKAHALLAAIYAKAGRWEQVKEHLAQGGPGVDEMGLLAAESFAAQGDAAEAEAWARRAIRFYRDRVLANPRDYASCLKLAQAQGMVREYAAAIELLETAWKDSKDPVFPKALAELSAGWLKAAGALAPSRRMALLQRGLAWDPQNQSLLQQVVDPAMVEAAGQAVATTSPVEGSAVRALCQAAAACRANQPDDVRAQLGLGLSMGDAQFPAVVANVACVWAYGQPSDAPSALLLSDALVGLRPRDPVAQRAQGLVLAKLGRWNLAAKYIEAALQAMPGDQALHSVLGSAYEKMGMPAEAAKQRLLAQPGAPSAPAQSPPAK